MSTILTETLTRTLTPQIWATYLHLNQLKTVLLLYTLLDFATFSDDAAFSAFASIACSTFDDFALELFAFDDLDPPAERPVHVS